MNVALLDVNVLIALFDPAHPNHEDAHSWFFANRKHGWATCPLTVNGCVRVLSNPSYPTVDARPEEVISRLRVLCASKDHVFWEDSVSLLDDKVFRVAAITGHQKVADAYLLALAVSRQGKLVTFDRSVPLRAVLKARPENLELLG